MNRTYWYAGLFLSLLLPAAHADTPFMLLNDADGFVNLRDVHRPDKIIARLHTPQVVASYGEDYPDRMQYHQISYSTAKAPAHFRRYAPLNPPGGLIHASRLKALDELPQFEAGAQSSRQQIFRHGSHRIEIDYEPLTRHRFDGLKNGFYHTLEGRPFFGFDGGISVAQLNNLSVNPIRQIKAITVHHRGQSLPFPPAAIGQMLNFNIQGAAIGDENTWYLYGRGGDGAGAYYSVWTLHQGRPASQFIWQY